MLNGSNVWDWDTDTIKCALATSGYTPDIDTHDFFNDVDGSFEISAASYTAGGKTLTTSAATYDTTSDQIRIDATDPSWTSASFTAWVSVIYKSTGTSSTSPLIIYIDFGGAETVSSGTFSIQFDSTGIGYIDVT